MHRFCTVGIGAYGSPRSRRLPRPTPTGVGGNKSCTIGALALLYRWHAYNVKDLKGELYFDDAVLQSSADDFGHVVHKKPVAMLRPGDAQDIAKLVQFANRHGLKVAMRDQGHSFFGQTQVEGGVVIDSSSA